MQDPDPLKKVPDPAGQKSMDPTGSGSSCLSWTTLLRQDCLPWRVWSTGWSISCTGEQPPIQINTNSCDVRATATYSMVKTFWTHSMLLNDPKECSNAHLTTTASTASNWKVTISQKKTHYRNVNTSTLYNIYIIHTACHKTILT